MFVLTAVAVPDRATPTRVWESDAVMSRPPLAETSPLKEAVPKAGRSAEAATASLTALSEVAGSVVAGSDAVPDMVTPATLKLSNEPAKDIDVAERLPEIETVPKGATAVLPASE